MAARFPQSASPITCSIAAAYAGKIHVVYWPAGPDSLHRLRSGESVTTIITRATSGATFDATTGRLTGTSTVDFTDSISGGYGGLKENSDFAFGQTGYGDYFGGTVPLMSLFTSFDWVYQYSSGFGVRNYSAAYCGMGAIAVGTAPYNGAPSSPNNNIGELFGIAGRNLQTDPTEKQKLWWRGTATSIGNGTATGTRELGGTATPFKMGASYNGGTTGLTSEWESAWFGAATLTNVEMAALSDDPSVLVEIPAPDTTPPTLTDATSAATSNTTGSGGVTTNEGTGTLYAVCTASSTAPTAVQVKAGQNASGVAAVYATSQAISSAGAKTVAATGLLASTSYYWHFAHEDGSGNISTVASSPSFTTDPPPASEVSGGATLDDITASGSMSIPPGVITTPVLKNNTGTVLASVSGVVANVYNQTTGALVVRKTGLASDASGIVTITDAALIHGTSYVYEIDLSAASMGRRLPVGVAA